jgi:hypothetical protein
MLLVNTMRAIVAMALLLEVDVHHACLATYLRYLFASRDDDEYV